jgi:hypothetical protein
MKISSLDISQLERNEDNYAFTKLLVDKLKNPVDNFEKLEVYSYNIGEFTYDAFITGEFTVALFSYQRDGDTIYEKKVWQRGDWLGLCRKIIFNYYLKKFSEVISDGIHSELGEKYWKKMLGDASRLGFQVRLFNNGNYLPLNLSKLDSYYSHGLKDQENKFSIKRET